MTGLRLNAPDSGHFECDMLPGNCLWIGVEQAYVDHSMSSLVMSQERARELRDWLNKAYPQ